jgi:CDP-6-deoxy-D-xylo-4-hexulose-3-dehydrase
MEYKLCEKTYGQEEIDAITDVLNSDKWTMGPYVEKFEKDFCKKFNFDYAVMVNSGSSANLLAMTALCNTKRDKFLKPGDEVLVPAVCWSTSVYPIIQNNLKPIFIDSSKDTLNITAEDINKYPNAKGIVLVHILGNSTDMDVAMKLANDRGLIVMEDTCESLTSKFNGKFLGSFGDMGTFSFYFSHHMTTIEGGMIICKTEFDYNLLKCIRSHGWTRYGNNTLNNVNNANNVNNKFCFVELGYNLRPMEFQGAMGSVQLNYIDKRNKIRKTNYNNITKSITNYHKNNNIMKFPVTTPGCESNWFCIPILLNIDFAYCLNDFMKYLDDNLIENRPIVTGNFTRQPVMKEIDKNINPELYTGAEIIHKTGLYISSPTHKIYTDCEINTLVDILFNFKEFNKPILFFNKPYCINKAIPYVTDAIESTWISMDGKYIEKSQNELKSITGCNYIILTLTGSAAILCMAKCLKYKYPNCKKIYIPNNTFMAGMNILLHEFSRENIELLDVDINTLNIENIENLEKNSALFVVHNVGGITNIPKLKRQRPDIYIFEDNSEGYLGFYENMPTGSAGIASVLSFNMNKNFTTGQGGAFCTNDKELYEYIYSYTRQGFTDQKFHHKQLGTNLRMSNITAAVLLSQIEQKDDIVKDKKQIYYNYKKYIALTNSKLKIQITDKNTESSYWSFAFRIDNNKSYSYIENELKKYNIDTRPMFLPIQEFEHLKDIKHNEITNSVKIHNEYILLPFNNVNENIIKYIVDCVNKII